ncbi:MAG: hypothetical protein ABH879_10705 [archaeon]
MVSRAYNLEGFVEVVESWGLTDVLLPFLLIFTIFFAILQKSDILGDDKKNMNVAVSVIIALIVVIPHVLGVYPSNALDPIYYLNTAIPTVSIIVVAIVMMLILIGLFGGQTRMLGVALPGWITLISFLLIIIVFGASAGWWGGWQWFIDFFGSDAVAIIIILLVFGILIAFITSGETKDNDKRKAFGEMGKNLQQIFGGGK